MLRRSLLTLVLIVAAACLAWAIEPIPIAIPAQFTIQLPVTSPSACWRVDRPADGRITAVITGPGTWNICIGDQMCPDDCMSSGHRQASTEPLTQGPYYYVKAETSSPGVAATLTIFPTAMGSWQGVVPEDLLGSVWEEVEGGWKGTWTRRGDSNIFDAAWTGPNGEKARDTLTMSVNGNQVTIRRRNLPNHVYTGTIGADGHVSGTAHDGRSAGTWKAIIRK